MSGASSSDHNPQNWIIRLGENAGVSLQDATDAKISFQVYRCTLADLVCLAGESH